MIIGLNCQQTKDIGIMKTTIKLRKPSLEFSVKNNEINEIWGKHSLKAIECHTIAFSVSENPTVEVSSSYLQKCGTSYFLPEDLSRIMEQMSSYAPVQSPGPSPLYLASVTLSVGTSRKSPMSQTAIHSSLTQHSQHKYMSRFHTNIFQLWIQVLLAHQCKLYKTMWKYKLPNVRR
ncbi:uncharacterized protein LOC136039967 isoform X2 [Artemia franciscana]|uniref:uncharacterized protein LOC136039967 isoform X2 n=1 Tax=Artemia franciscana TaxID=6661 RepID=UPI0032DAB428